MTDLKGLKKLTHTHLAEGEVTNHYHTAIGVEAVYEDGDGNRHFDASKGGAKVVHPEHKTITLPAKELIAGRTREMDHFEQAARQVQD